jgi:ketosteroid isomerase-like protein
MEVLQFLWNIIVNWKPTRTQCVDEPSAGMNAISRDAIEDEIRKYWAAFCSRAAAEVADFYASWAVVFGPAAERAESGQVATMRRTREYMHPQAVVAVKLGRIEVQELTDVVAVASYTYSFTARNIAKDSLGMTDQQSSHARATQVFQLIDGAPKIVHEHISVAWIPISTRASG